MSSNIYYDNIQKYLHGLVDLLNHSNRIGLTDKALHAENLFCEIFNIVFGWKLVNANEDNQNQDSFDLIDRKKKICVQVTANKKFKAKYYGAIRSFKGGNYSGINHFIVFFIAKKISKALPKTHVENEITYECLDIGLLLDKIYFHCKTPAKLGKLNKILQDTIEPVKVAFTNTEQPESITIPRQQSTVLRNGLYIDRSNLIKQLFDFSQIANGLVVGGPGFGKSFALEELQQLYVRKSLACFIIRINEITEGSDDEIDKELKASGNWLVALKCKASRSKNPNLLIFDAYDTAKDEKLKANILKQIRRSLQELSGNWRVLVSVRTYDAAKSRTLQELFPHENIHKTVGCRYFEIGELSEDELESSLSGHRQLKQIVSQCSSQFRQLLQTPYFLKLFERIVSDTRIPNDTIFSGIETEEQLLDIYWRHKIQDDHGKDLLAQKLTHILVTKEALVCNKTEVLEPTNVAAFGQLLSQGILIESSNGKRIGFAHNILLDFAVARYLLEEDLDTQISVISGHEKLPFIFRQSFLYFYAWLYKKENKLFWQHYFGILNIDLPLFRLLHQNSLNYVLVLYYEKFDDILPIFEEQQGDRRGQTIRRLLEAIRFITKGTLRWKDLGLLKYTSENLHWLLLWDLGFLLDKAINSYLKLPNKKYGKIISDACCNCIDFMLRERETFQHKHLIDRNGGVWGIDNLCKVFAYNKVKGKALIKRLLRILEEEDYPIHFFQYLSNHVLELYSVDRNLGVLVYKTLYLHIEASDKETSMGGGVVMNLRSNRKQDYSIVYHRLEETYKDLLKKDFFPAMRLGLHIFNLYNEVESKKYPNWPIYRVNIGDIKAKIISHYPFYDIHDKQGTISHVEKLFEVINEEALQASPDITHKVGKLISEIKSAKIWGKLIKTFATHTILFRDMAFDLLLNHAFFICDDTAYESGELIRRLWPILAAEEKKTIEKTILNLNQSSELLSIPGLAERRIARFLGCIPKDDLQESNSKKFVETHDLLPNTPTSRGGITAASIQALSWEEKMQSSGFSKDNEEDLRLYAQLEKLKEFNSQYRQNNKGEKTKTPQYKELLSIAQYLFGEAQGWKGHKQDVTEYVLSEFAENISSMGKKLSEDEKNIIKQFAVYYATGDQYNEELYQEGEFKNYMPAWGGTARTNAIQAVVNMMYTTRSKALEQIVIDLMNDNSQSVRYIAARAITYFWHHDREQFWNVIFDRIDIETDGFTYSALISAISYDNIITEDLANVKICTEKIVSKLKAKGGEVSHDLWQLPTILLLKLTLKYDGNFARQIISNTLGTKEFSRSLIFETMTVIDPHALGNDYSINPDKNGELIAVILEVVQYCFAELHRKGIEDSSIRDNFEIIDHVIQHLYFISERGRADYKDNILTKENKTAFYKIIRPILDLVVEKSLTIEQGFMVAHTGYYFMQLLNLMIDIDPEHILSLSNNIVLCAAKNGFTYDRMTLREIVKLTEQIIVDHKQLLIKKENFNSLIIILDQFAYSGWEEALELTWRLKDAF